MLVSKYKTNISMIPFTHEHLHISSVFVLAGTDTVPVEEVTAEEDRGAVRNFEWIPFRANTYNEIHITYITRFINNK